MAVVHVQATPKVVQSASGANVVCSFTTLPATGSSIIVTILGWGSSADFTITSVTDNQGNGTYTQSFISGAQGLKQIHQYIKHGIGTPSGTFSVTIDLAQPTNVYTLAVASEVTGLDQTSTVDQVLGNPVTSTTLDASVGPTGTTTVANEIVYAMMTLDNGDSTLNITVPSGYTEILVEQNGVANEGGEVAYKIVTGTGTQSAAWTHDNTSQTGWVAGIATYKGLAVAAPPLRALLLLGCGR